MESTLTQPVLFFEIFIPNLESFINQKIFDFVEHTGYNIIEVNKEKGFVIYSDVDIDNNTIELEYDVKKELRELLYLEFLKSKDLINECVLKYSIEKSNYIEYLFLQEKTLNFIVKKSCKTIESFPVLLKPLNSIINYINDKYVDDSSKELKLDISFLNLSDSSVDTNGNYHINSILGFLKEYNDKRQKIMTDEDHNLMISYVLYYVVHNNAPDIEKRIESVNISKALLRYSFWVLHKKLYTTRPIKDDFIQLLKDMFVCFDSWEFRTLKNKFGNKDKVTYSGKSFIPEVIKSELKG